MLKELIEEYQISFGPLINYFNNLATKDMSLISDTKEDNIRKIKFVIPRSGMRIQILCFKDNVKTWLSVYYTDRSLRLLVREVNFIMYNRTFIPRTKPIGMNNTILEHAITFHKRGRVARTVNSSYNYSDNELLTGWKINREVLTKDIFDIAKKDNLANLSIDIDSLHIPIVSKSEEAFDTGYQLVLK